MKKCGLLGHHLTHSYSPFIHGSFGDYEYSLFDKKENEVEDFLKNGDYSGLNVTMPYKKTAFCLMDELSEAAIATGSVNTVVKRTDGTLFGDNTDVYGFSELLRHSGFEVRGKKGLVLGSGGASAAVCEALRMAEAEYTIISRTGKDNYENIGSHENAEFIVNATPVGMYPDNGERILDISMFPELKAVFDVIYNPSRTDILLQAEKRGITAVNGLYMLVAQAKRSSERFMGRIIPQGLTDEVCDSLRRRMTNIVLVGMPGCGKTSVGKALAESLGREFFDSDSQFGEKFGIAPSEYIEKFGEARFRIAETEITAAIGMCSGAVIATGGGVVTRSENYEPLHQNGIIIWIKRELSRLATDDRPLSKDVEALYEARKGYYEAFSDISVENSRDIPSVVSEIRRLL